MGQDRSGRRLSRRVVLTSAAALAATVGWTPHLFAASGKAIKLGLVTPRTGPLASFAEADGFVVDAMRKAFANGI